ncbi:hypothetical protein B0H14DRAFT_2578958 [Mycena olivaceomarginata]|nr:hypothetical protein B0H14DRAFT_2578958 [Mycena olivaceomarginata]
MTNILSQGGTEKSEDDIQHRMPPSERARNYAVQRAQGGRDCGPGDDVIHREDYKPATGLIAGISSHTSVYTSGEVSTPREITVPSSPRPESDVSTSRAKTEAGVKPMITEISGAEQVKTRHARSKINSQRVKDRETGKRQKRSVLENGSPKRRSFSLDPREGTRRHGRLGGRDRRGREEGAWWRCPDQCGVTSSFALATTSTDRDALKPTFVTRWLLGIHSNRSKGHSGGFSSGSVQSQGKLRRASGESKSGPGTSPPQRSAAAYDQSKEKEITGKSKLSVSFHPNCCVGRVIQNQIQ